MGEAAILGSGGRQGYGRDRPQRAQLVCENCGGVVISLDLGRLKAGLEEGEPARADEGPWV